MAKDLSRLEAKDGRLGASRVGTSDPKNLRRLALGHGSEDLWGSLGKGAAPDAVVVEGFGVGVIAASFTCCWIC